jgi:hypothetical protein
MKRFDTSAVQKRLTEVIKNGIKEDIESSLSPSLGKLISDVLAERVYIDEWIYVEKKNKSEV